MGQGHFCACCARDGASSFPDAGTHEVAFESGYDNVRRVAHLQTEVMPILSRAMTQGLFKIKLDRSKGDQLGLDVDATPDNLSLLIVGLGGGVIDVWNLEHPALAVKQGDFIRQVNSVSGDVERLVEECKKKEVLELIVEPGNDELYRFASCRRFGNMCQLSCVGPMQTLTGVS